ncbi:MAG TPA: Rrf2 family transcriptional regulator [Flavobacteriales bacterium]|nr:Rrf2 family transcriptional regulator [Flavobacteriales bacterium]
MFFSKTCEYAFRAVVEIASASRHGNRLTMPVIAERIEAPQAFTAKVLQNLARSGVILSQRGPSGGFGMPPELAAQVNLRKVMRAIGEDVDRKACVMGLRQCGVDEPCPLHDQFVGMKDEMVRILCTTYVSNLVDDLEADRSARTSKELIATLI